MIAPVESGTVDDAAREPHDATSQVGWLSWAFHSDFSAYISRLADGRIDTTDGARRTEAGTFLFPPAPDGSEAPNDPASGEQSLSDEHAGADGNGLPEHPAQRDGELRWAGAVHFTGHHGLLAVTLADLAIRFTENARGGITGVLTMADPFAPGSRMTLADLGTGEREPGMAALRFPAPALTEEGADLFFGHYREGLVLAPLEVLAGTPTKPDLPASPAHSSDPRESR